MAEDVDFNPAYWGLPTAPAPAPTYTAPAPAPTPASSPISAPAPAPVSAPAPLPSGFGAWPVTPTTVGPTPAPAPAPTSALSYDPAVKQALSTYLPGRPLTDQDYAYWTNHGGVNAVHSTFGTAPAPAPSSGGFVTGGGSTSGGTTAPAPAPATGGTPTTGGTSNTFQEAYGPMYADLLSKINAWSSSPYEAYGGDRTAGANAYQTGAAEAIKNTNLPPEVQQALTALLQQGAMAPQDNYDPMTFSSRLPGTSAEDPYAVGSIQDYMNPYVQQALDPQLRELQRQSEMQRLADQVRLSKAGAYGGSRQAILQGENNRNAGQLQSDVLAKGYNTAYDKALDQMLNSSKLSLEAQGMTDKSNQFNANYGLDALRQQLATIQGAGDLGMKMGQFGIDKNKALGDMGNTLWGIEQKGLDADYEMFKDERDDPINKLLTATGALNSANSASRDPAATANSSSTANLLSSMSGIMALIDSLGK